MEEFHPMNAVCDNIVLGLKGFLNVDVVKKRQGGSKLPCISANKTVAPAGRGKFSSLDRSSDIFAFKLLPAIFRLRYLFLQE